MRTVPRDPEVDCEAWFDLGIMSADFKDSPATVLDLVDELLSRRGLEVVIVDTQDDSYTFKIEERAP